MTEILLIIAVIIAIQTTYITVTLAKHPKNSTSKQKRIFVDTSVLIDGRILDIANAGFIPGTLTIPRSVINELQMLADQADHEKRSRARHGLDVASQLQAISNIKVELFDDGVATAGVDRQLLELSKKFSGTICTIDFNLIKVAIVEGINVLNINDLAKTLRMAYLPGERTTIELTQRGNDQHQGVGHLGDGTMVVVEQAGSLIGQTVAVEFIRSLQTAAGRMMFAKLVDPVKRPAKQRNDAQRQPKTVAPVGRKKPTQQPQSTRPSHSRKQTNEDRMIELANR